MNSAFINNALLMWPYLYIPAYFSKSVYVFGCVWSFCLFIVILGFSRQEYWSGLPFPSPVDHVLSVLTSRNVPFRHPALALLWHRRSSVIACGLWLRHMGTEVAVIELCCSVACEILVPQPGIEAMLPALQGGLFTTGPLGKSPFSHTF